MQAEARPPDQRQPPARAAHQAREVVAGDVLHDLSARARDRPVGEHERHAEDQVARRAEAVPQRAGDVGREQRADGRVTRRIQREPLAAPRQLVAKRREPHAGLDRAGEVAGVVLEDAIEALGRQVVAEPNMALLLERVREEGRGFLDARDARQRRSSRARARGRARAPRRRAAAWGSPCPGWRCRRGRTRVAGARRR